MIADAVYLVLATSLNERNTPSKTLRLPYLPFKQLHFVPGDVSNPWGCGLQPISTSTGPLRRPDFSGAGPQVGTGPRRREESPARSAHGRTFRLQRLPAAISSLSCPQQPPNPRELPTRTDTVGGVELG